MKKWGRCQLTYLMQGYELDKERKGFYQRYRLATFEEQEVILEGFNLYVYLGPPETEIAQPRAGMENVDDVVLVLPGGAGPSVDSEVDWGDGTVSDIEDNEVIDENSAPETPGPHPRVPCDASVPYLAGWESREHYMVAYQPKRRRLNGKGWAHQQHLDRRLQACIPTKLPEENRYKRESGKDIWSVDWGQSTYKPELLRLWSRPRAQCRT